MANFFKTFLKGILYVITFPLLVVFLAVYFVFSLFAFIVLSIKGLILFFKGESITGELKEDIEAKKRMDALMDPLGAIEKVRQEQEQIKQNQIRQELTTQIRQEPPYVELIQDKTLEEDIISKSEEIKIDEEEKKTIDILEPNEEPIPEEEVPFQIDDEKDKDIKNNLNKELNNEVKIEEISIKNDQKPFYEQEEIDEEEYTSGVTIEGINDKHD